MQLKEAAHPAQNVPPSGPRSRLPAPGQVRFICTPCLMPTRVLSLASSSAVGTSLLRGHFHRTSIRPHAIQRMLAHAICLTEVSGRLSEATDLPSRTLRCVLAILRSVRGCGRLSSGRFTAVPLTYENSASDAELGYLFFIVKARPDEGITCVHRCPLRGMGPPRFTRVSRPELPNRRMQLAAFQA